MKLSKDTAVGYTMQQMVDAIMYHRRDMSAVHAAEIAEDLTRQISELADAIEYEDSKLMQRGSPWRLPSTTIASMIEKILWEFASAINWRESDLGFVGIEGSGPKAHSQMRHYWRDVKALYVGLRHMPDVITLVHINVIDRVDGIFVINSPRAVYDKLISMYSEEND